MALDLSGFGRIKKTVLNIDSMDVDGGVNNDTLILFLEEEVESSSRNFTNDKGEPVKVVRKEVRVSETEVEEFKKNYDDATGIYSGSMKLDVSKPKGNMGADGQFKITKEAQVWLTGIPFVKRGQALRKDRNDAMSNALKVLFGGESFTEKKKEAAVMAENGG